MRVLLDVNRRALELTDAAAPDSALATPRRVNFGVYVFDEHEPPTPGEPS